MSVSKEWLALLAQAMKGPVTMPVAVRGQTYAHTITLVGVDYTSAALSGSIRAAPDSATALATFTIGAPSLAGGNTVWTVSLSAAQTGALPADGDGDGVETFPYDFLLDGHRLFGGAFYLSGHITEPA